MERTAWKGESRPAAFFLDWERHLSGGRVLVLAAILAATAGAGWYLAADGGIQPDRTLPIFELSAGLASSGSGESSEAAPVQESMTSQSGAGAAIPGLPSETGARPLGAAENAVPTLPAGEAAATVPISRRVLDRESAAGLPDGERIRAVQRALDRLGYDPGPVDGAMGPRTRTAIWAFQAASGLTGDGKLTPELEREIRIAAAATGL